MLLTVSPVIMLGSWNLVLSEMPKHTGQIIVSALGIQSVV